METINDGRCTTLAIDGSLIVIGEDINTRYDISNQRYVQTLPEDADWDEITFDIGESIPALEIVESIVGRLYHEGTTVAVKWFHCGVVCEIDVKGTVPVDGVLEKPAAIYRTNFCHCSPSITMSKIGVNAMGAYEPDIRIQHYAKKFS